MVIYQSCYTSMNLGDIITKCVIFPWFLGILLRDPSRPPEGKSFQFLSARSNQDYHQVHLKKSIKQSYHRQTNNFEDFEEIMGKYHMLDGNLWGLKG